MQIRPGKARRYGTPHVCTVFYSLPPVLTFPLRFQSFESTGLENHLGTTSKLHKGIPRHICK